MWAKREQGLTAAQADEFSNGATQQRSAGGVALAVEAMPDLGPALPHHPHTPARRPHLALNTVGRVVPVQ